MPFQPRPPPPPRRTAMPPWSSTASRSIVPVPGVCACMAWLLGGADLSHYTTAEARGEASECPVVLLSLLHPTSNAPPRLPVRRSAATRDGRCRASTSPDRLRSARPGRLVEGKDAPQHVQRLLPGDRRGVQPGAGTHASPHEREIAALAPGVGEALDLRHPGVPGAVPLQRLLLDRRELEPPALAPDLDVR